MAVSSRLLLIIALCLLPSLGLQLWASWSQWSDRKAQLGELTRNQAELLAGDVDSIVSGAQILLNASREFHQVRIVGESCNIRLEALQRHAAGFAFLVLVDAAGRVRCASDPALLDATNPAWTRIQHPPRAGFHTGTFTQMAGYPGGVLPFFLPLDSADPDGTGTLIAALDLRWFGSHLAGLKRSGTPFLTRSVLTVADSQGVILARDVRHDEFVGRPFPPAAMALVTAQQPGILRLKSIDGTERVVGYTPPTPANHALAAVVGFHEPDLMSDLEQALWGGMLALVVVSLAAFVLVMLIARRYIAQPTKSLLAVARRWREGDLGVRAPGGGGGSEFDLLAAAFNDMAAALQARERELRGYAEEQEARVKERTHELVLANERLQAEVAGHRNTEAALLQAQKVQAVGQLAGGIAHDFNNVLQAVAGSANLIRRRSQDPAAVLRLTEMILRSAQRGESITRRLLTFARREELHAAALDLGDLVAELREILATTFSTRYQVEVAIPAKLPPVFVDRGHFETVLVNLATNARDAMPDGGTLRLSAAMEQVAAGRPDLGPGEYVRLAIADNGRGMTAETLARATEPFFTTKPLGQGTGLGLAMARSFAEGSGGALTIASAPGEGTTITLWLPAVAPAAACKAAALPADTAPPAIRPGWRPRILLVDDEPAVRHVLAEELRYAGYDVVERSDGKAALDVLAEPDGVDALVTDLAMPELDGAALIRAAQRLRPGLHAILVTGFAGEATRQAVEAALPETFTLLRKPVTGSQLADALAMLLGCRPDATPRWQPAL